MKNKNSQDTKNKYNIIISELGINPLRVARSAFALMGIIPLLVIFYIIVGRHFLYELLLGQNGFIITMAIFISLTGFLYAYRLVDKMIKKLLLYSSECKRAEDEKTELFFAISHDLKTPLTIIKTGISNLIGGVGGVLSKAHLDIAQICLRAVDRGDDFINEIMNFSKTGFIRINFRRKLVDFGKIIKDETDDISKLAEEKNQRLKYTAECKNFTMWLDEKKISRLVGNLLSNAIKYTPGGGKIDVVLSGDEYTAKLAVVNTGPGISVDKIDKIFERYERLKGNPGIEGTGLGLSIAKDIVDLHKGHITVTSEPDKETKFNVILPRDLRAR